MMQTTTRPAPYKPHLEKVSDTHYSCQSQSNPDVTYHMTVSVVDGSITCSCPAGTHFRACKHARALAHLMAYRAHPTHLRPAVVPAPALPFRAPAPAPAVAPTAKPLNGFQTCTGCGLVRWGLLLEDGWCACQQQVRGREPLQLADYRGAAGLAEAFES